MEWMLALTAGLGVGVFIGWTVGRGKVAAVHAELDKERAVQSERLKTYRDAERSFRDAFQALSADALKTNNEAFLHLAESRLREARTEAAQDIDDRRKAIEALLAPMKTTLDQVDREIKDSERRRTET